MCTLNLVSYYSCHMIVTLWYVLPNLGVTPKTELANVDYVLVYPRGYLIFAGSVTFTKFIYILVHSRGYILRTIFKASSLSKKFTNLLIFLFGTQFDFPYFPREEPPLLFLIDPEVKVNENWIDNQESQHVFICVKFLS